MSLFQEFSPRQGGRTVLLSIKPKYADLILSGSKRVEFRRSWAKEDVSMLVLYSSSPVQKIVGVVEVENTIIAPPKSLWETSVERCGGLTKDELRNYFSGKEQGVAVLLGQVFKPAEHIKPLDVIDNFVPPQSFRYLRPHEYIKLEKKMSHRRTRL